MALDIAAIRQGIADALDGLNVNVYAYPPPLLDPPAVVVGLPQQVQPNKVLNGDQLTMVCTFYAARVDAEDAMQRMDRAISVGVDGSIVDVLRSATASGAWRGKPIVPLVESIRESDFGEGARFLAADIFLTLIA